MFHWSFFVKTWKSIVGWEIDGDEKEQRRKRYCFICSSLTKHKKSSPKHEKHFPDVRTHGGDQVQLLWMMEEVVLACPELGDAQSEPLKEIELAKKAKHFYHLCVGKKKHLKNLEQRSWSVSSSHSKASHRKSPRGNSVNRGRPSNSST